MNPSNLIPPSHGGSRGRPRNSFTSRQAATEARQKRLEDELKGARRAAREAIARQAEIVGRAMMRAVTTHPDPAFRRALVAWLRQVVTKNADRAEIAGLLIEGDGK